MANTQDARREKKRAADAAYYAANRERLLEKARLYQAAHKDERTAYRAAHREEHHAQQAAYRAEHLDEKAAYNAVYRETHQDEQRAYRATRCQKNRYYVGGRMDECVDCGGTAVLWHHVDPTQKRYGISEMMNCSQESIGAELAKCVPLCRACHWRRHNQSFAPKANTCRARL